MTFEDHLHKIYKRLTDFSENFWDPQCELDYSVVDFKCYHDLIQIFLVEIFWHVHPVIASFASVCKSKSILNEHA